jgi:hypothetical protein
MRERLFHVSRFTPSRITHVSKKKEEIMKQEDIWMVGIVLFAILFTASFGWGLWG